MNATEWYLIVLYLIIVTVAAVTVGQYFHARRPMGTVATPRGPRPVPTDAALRAARAYYRHDPTIPIVATEWLRSSVYHTNPVPVPVPEGAEVLLYERQMEKPRSVIVTVVIPRPGSWSGKAGDPASPVRFQYLGFLPSEGVRVMFHQADIWEVLTPAPVPEEPDAA